jgi:hypothetical protein
LCHRAIVKGSRHGCIEGPDALPGVQHMAAKVEKLVDMQVAEVTNNASA